MNKNLRPTLGKAGHRLGRALAGLVVVTGLALAAGCGKSAPPAGAPAAAAQALYQCPMHPTYTSDRAGSCPICGMDLVRIAQTGAAAFTNVSGRTLVPLSSEQQQLIGLTTAPVAMHRFAPKIHAAGMVAMDEAKSAWITPKIGGWVDKIYADRTALHVKAGDPLFELYSPDLISAQEEYLAAVRAGGTNSPAARASEQRLLLWDVSPAQMAGLRAAGKPGRTTPFNAPFPGWIFIKNILPGQQIMPGERLYHLGEMDTIWIEALLYAEDFRLMATGLPVQVTSTAFPDKTWPATVTQIIPPVNPATRTAGIRIVMPNPDLLLWPDAYVDLMIETKPHEAVAVPAAAVLDTGMGKLAYVDLRNQHFEPRAVTTGVRDGELLEILSGLEEGERVVDRAVFLLDSESQLQAVNRSPPIVETTNAPATHRH